MSIEKERLGIYPARLGTILEGILKGILKGFKREKRSPG